MTDSKNLYYRFELKISVNSNRILTTVVHNVYLQASTDTCYFTDSTSLLIYS